MHNICPKPETITQDSIMVAKDKLQAIFNAEDANEADKMYRQGLSDYLSKRRDTEAARFYIEVEVLSEIANRAYDKPYTNN